MATKIPAFCGSLQQALNYEAGEAIAEGDCVKLTAAGLLNVSDTSGELCLGIAQQAAVAGEMVAVAVGGLSGFVAGGALTSGTHSSLMSAGNGKLVAYVSGAGNFMICNFMPNKNSPVLADGKVGTGVVLGGAIPAL